ncbi:MAG: helix-turn-helix transcriptional regulator [Fibromonadaceae bacterium]|jgi:transcriptional regulator with XRE-family HTH domain|nr:helix-turn-helix transcriptional regulator [Fibromonadaceae bacterium]
MAFYEGGKLIKRLRKQKNITQEELAYSIVDRATLSKIENGKSESSKETIMALLEKLGFRPSSSIDFYLNDEQSKVVKIQNELNSCLSMQVYDKLNPVVEKIDALIKELESDEVFMQNPRNKQYVLISKATNLVNKQEEPSKIRLVLMEAIKFNIVTFDENRIDEYYLTKNDVQILNLLGISYAKEGYVSENTNLLDKGINVFSGLKRNYELHCLDKDEMGLNYPSFCYNIAKYIWEDKKMYKEAIAVCDDGIKVCKETFHFRLLPFLSSCKAVCLFHLGENQEAETIFTQSHSCDVLVRNARQRKRNKSTSRRKI